MNTNNKLKEILGTAAKTACVVVVGLMLMKPNTGVAKHCHVDQYFQIGSSHIPITHYMTNWPC